MGFRVSFFCQVQMEKLGGWSENFWNSSNELADVTTQATALRSRMFRAKGVPVQMPSVRISDLDHFREVKVMTFPASNLTTTNLNSYADFVNTAALLKLGGDPNYVTRQWFRGLYDDDIRLGGRWDPAADSTRLMNAFFAALTAPNNNWCLRKIDRATPKKTVTAITQLGVVACVAHGLVTDDKTRISRVMSPTALNRIWKVIKIDNDTFSIVGPPTMTGAAQVGISTVSQKQNYSLIPLKRAVVERATSHRTGRPFGQLSGRRKTRRT